MLRDHRPYYIKRLDLRLRDWYVEHFIRPQLQHLGKGYTFMKPWHMEVFGGPVSIGDCVNIITTPEHRVRLTIWSENEGRINIGNYCLICPGVRISSAKDIRIGDSCMLAANAYITDSDWHDIYDRVSSGRPSPVSIGNNVWIGDSVIVCKGVSIGDNVIIGAGSVVIKDIPENCIAAGNPAVIVKKLDPDREMNTRAHWFANPEELVFNHKEIDKDMLKGNTMLGWLRSVFFPTKKD
ncbi:MAG: acyltransferase [Thermodesulfobacteriota bacterium]|nr:acyltransferase [Thermodesulfobacteriota bacterium]